MANASPAACGTCVVTTDEPLTMLSAVELKWLGICRPPLQRIVFFAEQTEHEIGRRDANGERQRQIAVVGVDVIDAAIDGIGRADLCAFVPHRADVKGDFSLPVQRPGAFVQAAAEQHHPEHFQQRLLAQAGGSPRDSICGHCDLLNAA